MALLLGPPELHRKPPSSTIPTPSITPTGNPFMDQMLAHFNSTNTSREPFMGKTHHGSATYLSSGNSCLDFFFHIVPNSPSCVITDHLVKAWSHDPLTTLKLICNLRGVRGTGKSDKESYYTAALWLHKLHPKTLACNVPTMANFGYFKDFPEILYRVLEGDDVRERAKRERKVESKRMRRNRRYSYSQKKTRQPFGLFAVKKRKTKKGSAKPPRDVRVLAEMKRAEIGKENAKQLRDIKKVALAKKAFEKYCRDPDYKFLHDRVSDFFAESLKKDMAILKSGDVRNIGLAAKWCPSLDSSFDKTTLICESIAKKMFPKAECVEYKDVEEAHYAYRVRDRLRKEVLVPLRKALELPETFIGANAWGSIPYNRVASVAMTNYKDLFVKHDKERYEEYLKKGEEGKVKVAAGALLPHEIIEALNDDDRGRLAELQWKRMVQDLSEQGTLKNCLAMCGVSQIMEGTPLEVSIALGILVSELSEEPWKGKIITFNQKPTLQMVAGDRLRDKTDFIRRMEWGQITDFQRVFDLILDVAVKGKLTKEQMIKRVFVFSDMDFYRASMNPWETDYMVIRRKYAERGYKDCVPEMVFWNLSGSTATPVPGYQNGAALVSGFSKNLLNLFLKGGGVMDPQAVMESAISGEDYTKLAVVD